MQGTTGPPRITSSTAPKRYARTWMRWVAWVLDRLGSWLLRSPVPSRLLQPGALVVVQLDRLGDAMLALPTLRALGELYPGVELQVVCAPWNAAAFELLQEAAITVLPLNQGMTRSLQRWEGRWLPRWVRRASGSSWLGELEPWRAWVVARAVHRLVRSPALEGGAWAIDLQGSPAIRVGLYLAGVRVRLGSAHKALACLLTHPVAGGDGPHQSESYLALARAVGWKGRPCAELLQSLVQERVAGLLPGRPAGSSSPRAEPSSGGPDLPTGPYIALHVGARGSYKQWPVERWIELVRGLVDLAPEHTMVLVGSDEDAAPARALAAHWRRSDAAPPRVDWVGGTSLPDLARLLHSAALVVGCDAAPTHLAAPLGTPCVVLMNPAVDIARWRPLGPRVWVQARAAHRCVGSACPEVPCPSMAALGAAEVLAAARAALAQGR
jgi:ADP-heptose:LPS heptosyltransferase